MVAVILLTLISFIQSSLLPFEWVLLALISRSFLRQDNKNYYLAFGFGIFLSLLLSQPLGFLSLVYVLVVKIVHTARGLTIGAHWLAIIPIIFLNLSLLSLINLIIFKSSIELTSLLLQTILGVVIYFIVRIWEDRFTRTKGIRLKI